MDMTGAFITKIWSIWTSVFKKVVMFVLEILSNAVLTRQHKQVGWLVVVQSEGQKTKNTVWVGVKFVYVELLLSKCHTMIAKIC